MIPVTEWLKAESLFFPERQNPEKAVREPEGNGVLPFPVATNNRLLRADSCWNKYKNKAGTMSAFQKDIEWLLKSHHILEAFQNQTEFHVRFEIPGFDRLVIERHGSLISVAHYFEQNGDLMADPEVEFHYPTWFPTAITQVIGGRREKFIQRNGQEFVVVNFHNEVTSFLVMWGRNIRAQGWDRASSTITSNAEVVEEQP